MGWESLVAIKVLETPRSPMRHSACGHPSGPAAVRPREQAGHTTASNNSRRSEHFPIAGRGAIHTRPLVGLRRRRPPLLGAPRPRWSTSTPRTVRASARPPTWPGSGRPAGGRLRRLQAPAGEPPAGAIRLAFCWAHCRRRFYEIHQATGAPLAEKALRQIRELYVIEAEIRGRPAEERRAARQERSSRRGGAERLARGAAGAGLGQVHPG